MPDQNEPPLTPKKHRVIHWNPEDDENLEKANNSTSKYIAAGVIALVVIVGSMLAYKVVLGGNSMEYPTDGQVVLSEDGTPQQNFQQAFVSRAKAEMRLDSTSKKMKEIERMTTNHGDLRDMLINISIEFGKGEDLMRRNAYKRALDQLAKVDTQIEEFTNQIETEQLAQEMYDNFLVKVDELESNRHLNELAYEKAFEAASTGNQFLQEGSFYPAKTKLEEAHGHLEDLSSSVQEFIQSNAALGHRYIAQGQGAQAIEAFTNVLTVDPTNEEAVRHLERAKFADQVFALLQQADQKEANEELEAALEDFQQAFEIDGGSAKAQQGISRTTRKIQNRDFDFHLTAARQAESTGRYEEAIGHFQSALQIFPARTDLTDAIIKARQDKRKNDIYTMITRAYNLEEDYDWEGARGYYQKLLQLEPEFEQAKEGMIRTGKMIRGLLRYEKYIEVAMQEARRADFQLAIRSFDTAMQSKPEYLELSDEAENLRRFLQLQSQPVPVTFVSDMATWVSFQGPTKLKPTKLKEKNISLLPGKYHVVGRKKGYEDVRFPLNIRAGRGQNTLTVICNVKRD